MHDTPSPDRSPDLASLRSPLYGAMDRIPGGTMVIPLVLGAVVGTTAPAFLELGSFTTALFGTPMPLMALVIFATGMQITPRSIGPVAGTTAGNSIVTPVIIAAADPRFEQYVDIATVQVATAVLISAITAPLIAAWFLRRSGALSSPDQDGLDDRGMPLRGTVGDGAAAGTRAAGAESGAAGAHGAHPDDDLEPSAGTR